MKKMSNRGFTLIELLAVITIMGILMMVAIPAVTRTIENSRRDTFADIAGEYIKTIRNAVIADNIVCYESGGWRVASANPDGTYYFPICTSQGTCADVSLKKEDGSSVLPKTDIQQSTIDIMESGGKSPFGNAEMRGYVKFVKTTKAVSATGDGVASNKTTVTYSIVLVDSGKHGIASEKLDTEITRSAIATDVSDDLTNEPSGAIPCKMS